jgi:hypothetical protein
MNIYYIDIHINITNHIDYQAIRRYVCMSVCTYVYMYVYT